MRLLISPGIVYVPSAGEILSPVLTNLVAWYKFDEGSGQVLTDYSGNGNHGQLGSTAGADTNDPTWVTEGLSFDAVDNYVDIPSLVFSGDKTIIAVARTPIDGSTQIIVSDKITQNWFYYRTVGADTLRVFNTSEVVEKAATATDWNFLAHRQSGSTGNVSVNNGTPVADATYTALNFANGVFLGRWSTVYFGGEIAYLLVYSASLSDADLTSNYDFIKSAVAGRGISLP